MLSALRVVAEPRRQAILHLVWDEEQSAGQIAAHLDEITFGAVSQHLRVLQDAGFIDQRREGTRRLYRANKEALGPLRQYLELVWATHLDTLKAAAEAAARRKRKKKGGRR